MVNDSRSTQYNQDLPWSLVTKRVSGVLWGYLSGLACPLHTLAKAWTEPYREIIALDHDPCLLDSPEYGVLNVPFGKRQHAQTLWLLEKFQPPELRMFLLAFKIPSAIGISGPFGIGLVMHERSHRGLRYWHRLGICVWTVRDFGQRHSAAILIETCWSEGGKNGRK